MCPSGEEARQLEARRDGRRGYGWSGTDSVRLVARLFALRTSSGGLRGLYFTDYVRSRILGGIAINLLYSRPATILNVSSMMRLVLPRRNNTKVSSRLSVSHGTATEMTIGGVKQKQANNSEFLSLHCSTHQGLHQGLPVCIVRKSDFVF